MLGCHCRNRTHTRRAKNDRLRQILYTIDDGNCSKKKIQKNKSSRINKTVKSNNNDENLDWTVQT